MVDSKETCSLQSDSDGFEEDHMLRESHADCVICQKPISNVILMCPKCGKALMCQLCVNLLTEDRCPSCA